VEAKRGDRVQIYRVILRVGERAPQVPEDTAAVPLEMTVRGDLLEDTAAAGDEVTVETPAGRRLRGRLIALDPPYNIGFGPPPPELRQVGKELRKILSSGARGHGQD
jgi:hypothetical protein